jgi:hypothetical protein
MMSSDTHLEKYYSLNPASFGFLESLELRQSVLPPEWTGFTLMLRLRSSTSPEAKCLTLEFGGVHDFRAGPLEGLLRYYLEVRSIRDQQMEQRNYRVVESEYNALAFDCCSFVATLEND